MICVECINRRPKEGYRKSNIHLDAKEERRASYEKIYFIIYYDACQVYGKTNAHLWMLEKKTENHFYIFDKKIRKHQSLNALSSQ